MKVTIETDENFEGGEVIIRCKEITKDIEDLYEIVRNHKNKSTDIAFFKGNSRYYFPAGRVCFFETDADNVYAHTSDDTFRVTLKLYELEECLPSNFIRVAKSTIVNVSHVYSVEKSITASSLVSFQKTKKQVYVSRKYYKPFMQRLEEHYRSSVLKKEKQ